MTYNRTVQKEIQRAVSAALLVTALPFSGCEPAAPTCGVYGKVDRSPAPVRLNSEQPPSSVFVPISELALTTYPELADYTFQKEVFTISQIEMTVYNFTDCKLDRKLFQAMLDYFDTFPGKSQIYGLQRVYLPGGQSRLEVKPGTSGKWTLLILTDEHPRLADDFGDKDNPHRFGRTDQLNRRAVVRIPEEGVLKVLRERSNDNQMYRNERDFTNLVIATEMANAALNSYFVNLQNPDTSTKGYFGIDIQEVVGVSIGLAVNCRLADLGYKEYERITAESKIVLDDQKTYFIIFPAGEYALLPGPGSLLVR